MNIPPGYAQINHILAGAGLPRGAQVTYGVTLVGTPTPAAVALEAHADFQGRFQALMTTAVTCTGTRVKIGPTDTGPFAVAGAAWIGTNATAADAPQVSVLITKETALGGRSNRGRWFLPGIAEADTVGGGVMTEAAQTLYQTRCNGFLSDIQGGTNYTDMVVLHNAEEQEPTVVNNLIVQLLLATQRRRIRRVGGRRRPVVL